MSTVPITTGPSSLLAPDGRGGVAGSAAVLCLALIAVALPERSTPIPLGEAGSSYRPALLLAVGMVAFVLASPDPARRPTFRPADTMPRRWNRPSS